MAKPTRFRDLPPERQAFLKARMTKLRGMLVGLIDTFADRLPAQRLENVRSLAVNGGEYAMAMGWMLPTLVRDRIPLSVEERDLLAVALTELGDGDGSEPWLEDPTGTLAALTVIDDRGIRISPPADLDLDRWSPRRQARYLTGCVGGHHHDAGVPRKTTFPAHWDAEKINALTLDVARNPDEIPQQTRSGGWITRGTRESVLMEVRLRPDGAILTGYPLAGPGVRHTDADGSPTDTTW